MKSREDKARAEYHEQRRAERLDVNAVVSFRIKTIRERRGWTQDFFAERLAAYTGKRLPQASISAIERGFEAKRRRRFDAQELYVLSRVFQVPIVYFFIPPKEMMTVEIADGEDPASQLYKAFIGGKDELEPVDEALADLGLHAPEMLTEVTAALYGPDGPYPWKAKDYRVWRAARIRVIAEQFADRMDDVKETLREIVTKLDGMGLHGWFAENAWQQGDDQDVMDALTGKRKKE